MKIQNRSSEKGQLLVILVLGLVGLIGFAALAIDGGMAFSDRRNDQNGADAAALAGGWAAVREFQTNEVYAESFTCSDLKVVTAISLAQTAATARALSNNFLIDPTDPINPKEVNVNCSNSGQYLDVHVKITTTTRTSLIHLFYNGPVKNTVEAVARVKPMQTIGFGAAIASMSPNCNKPSGTHYNSSDGGIIFDGNNSTLVKGGGIFSNSCLYPNGQPSVKTNPPTPGLISYITTIEGSTKGTTNFDPVPSKAATPLKIIEIHPDCTEYGSSTTNNFVSNNDQTILPGVYTHTGNKPAIEAKKGVLTLKPGLYCVDGDFSISAQAEVTTFGTLPVAPYNQDGVTIYMRNGNFDMGGGGKVTIWAKAGKPEPPSNAIPGLLIYMPPNPTNNFGIAPTYANRIDMAGNTASIYEGTVYAPYSYINFGGNPDAASTVNTELIGWVIRLDGAATIGIHYNGEVLFHEPATLSQYK